MKKVTIIALGIILLASICKAQCDVVRNVYINNIAWSDFGTDDFERTIGKAEKSIATRNENSYRADCYERNGSSCLFYNDGRYQDYPIGYLTQFIFATPGISVRLDTTTIQVGDSIEKLKKPFPTSYNSRETSGYYGEGMGSIKVGRSIIGPLGNTVSVETPISILYNLTTEKITKITYLPLP